MTLMSVRIVGSVRHPDWVHGKRETDEIIISGLNRIFSPVCGVRYSLWTGGKVDHLITFSTVYLGRNERGKHEHAAGWGYYDDYRVRIHDGWILPATGNNHPGGDRSVGYWHGSYWFTRPNGVELLQRTACHEVGHNYGLRHVGGNCLMNINLNSDRVCGALRGVLVSRFGPPEDGDYVEPVPVGTRVKRINFPETGRAALLLQDGRYVNVNNSSLQLSGEMVVRKIGPPEEREKRLGKMPDTNETQEGGLSGERESVAIGSFLWGCGAVDA